MRGGGFDGNFLKEERPEGKRDGGLQRLQNLEIFASCQGLDTKSRLSRGVYYRERDYV